MIYLSSSLNKLLRGYMENSNKNDRKDTIKKIIKNASFFVILIILTYYFIFRKINRKGLQEALINTNLFFILVACVLASFNIFFESINHYRNLKLLNEETSFKKCLKYGIVGFFFSAITPAATGGQPVQIYYMHKDNISYTHATITILVQSFAYLSTMIFLGIIGYIVNFKYINSLGFIEYFFFIGILANGIITAISLIAMFSSNLSHKILDFIYRIIYKFNEEKANNFKEKLTIQLDEYHVSAKFILSNKKAILKTFLTTILQLVSYHSVAYFVFLALNVQNINYFNITFLQSVLYLSVSILPLPGTVGVNETGFSLLYNPIIAQNIVDSAMLLTRGISFYLIVIITGIILMIISLKKNKNTKS